MRWHGIEEFPEPFYTCCLIVLSSVLDGRNCLTPACYCVTHLVVHGTSGSTSYETFHTSDWRPLETCCRPWTWWCNDAMALAGYANMMMMMMDLLCRQCRLNSLMLSSCLCNYADCLCCNAVQLLNEEYAALSPDTLESLGFLTSVAKDPGLSDTQKKVFGTSFDIFCLKLASFASFTAFLHFLLYITDNLRSGVT